MSKSATYLLRLTPEQKAELERRSARAGLTLADVFRTGAAELLSRRECIYSDGRTTENAPASRKRSGAEPRSTP